MTWRNTILVGDVREQLATLPDESVHCVVTSPPYFGLRDYGVEGQIGLEETINDYVCAIVAVFRQVRRVLRPDGPLWLNLGDSYAGSWGAQGRRGSTKNGSSLSRNQITNHPKTAHHTGTIRDAGLKPKDLIGIPWRVAFALQEDGWWLRSDVVWAKPNPMPESVTDRPTKSHEYLFLMARSERYFYDFDAIKEPVKFPQDNLPEDHERAFTALRMNGPVKRQSSYKSGNTERKMRTDFGGNPEILNTHQSYSFPWEYSGGGRNKRSVWDVATEPMSIVMCAACMADYSGAEYRRLAAGSSPRCTTEINQGEKCGSTSWLHAASGIVCASCETFYKAAQATRLPKAHVCRCGRDDAWLSHFATYPQALVLPCIQAGTSEHGVCSCCGAPWRRLVERDERNLTREPAHAFGNTQTKVDSTGWTTGNPRTTGWEPTCKHEAPIERAVVLDPFMGSGTTGLVAFESGRDFVGIELNPTYAEMARRRIGTDRGRLL